VCFLCGVSGSLTSCDSFLAAFESKGLRHGAICPCASSPEAATASIRRFVKLSLFYVVAILIC